jgi:hypothetical protein
MNFHDTDSWGDDRGMEHGLHEESDDGLPDDFDGARDSKVSNDAATEQVKENAEIKPEQPGSIDAKPLNAEFRPVVPSVSNSMMSHLPAVNELSGSIGATRASSDKFQGMVSGVVEFQNFLTASVEHIRPPLDGISGISTVLDDTYACSKAPFESVMGNVLSTANIASHMLLERPNAMTQFAEQIESQSESINRMVQSAASVLSDVWVPNINSVVSLTEQFSSSISHVFEQLIKGFPSFDWLGKGEAIVRWGKHGWVIYPTMSMNVILDVPDSRIEADEIMRSCLTTEYMQGVRNRLTKAVRRKSDLEEALWLFDQRHYKPCAMVLCSMIEGELFNRAKKNGKGRRSAKEPIDRLQKLCSAEGVDACVSAYIAMGACESYGHFFADGKDFKRDIEGDLNRNFLQHGMMYKRVTRTVCVKLLLLLDGIVEACSVYL